MRSCGVAFVVLVACGPAAKPPEAPPSNHPPAPKTPPPPEPAANAVLGWPVARFTKLQITEVSSCGIEKLATSRYPKTMTIDALPAAFAPHGTCDEAALAAACGARFTDAEPPARCLEAYRTAVKANPAFAFAGELTGPYFGKLAIVGAPPVARRRLASVVLDYTWGGLGDAVHWTLTAKDLGGSPTLAVTGPQGKPAAKWTTEAGAAVTALGAALTSFLPIPKPLKAIDCTDNYPEWAVTLVYDDGTKIELTTEGSNLIGMGGPWQMTVDGVTYMQLGPELIRAIADILKAFDLKLGEPMGSMCRGYDLEHEVLVP